MVTCGNILPPDTVDDHHRALRQLLGVMEDSLCLIQWKEDMYEGSHQDLLRRPVGTGDSHHLGSLLRLVVMEDSHLQVQYQRRVILLGGLLQVLLRRLELMLHTDHESHLQGHKALKDYEEPNHPHPHYQYSIRQI